MIEEISETFDKLTKPQLKAMFIICCVTLSAVWLAYNRSLDHIKELKTETIAQNAKQDEKLQILTDLSTAGQVTAAQNTLRYEQLQRSVDMLRQTSNQKNPKIKHANY